MAGARIICGSDRFDDSGLFGALIPEELKGKQIIEPILMKRFSNIGTKFYCIPGSIIEEGVLMLQEVYFMEKVSHGQSIKEIQQNQ